MTTRPPEAPTDDPVATIRRRAWLRAILAGALCTAVISMFSAGSCHFHGCHHDDDFDDDHYCDDDDDDVGNASTEAQAPPSYRLEDFVLVTESVRGAHPVVRVSRIEGISLTAWEGSREFGVEELADFTAKILEYNDELIGLPPAAGRLEFAKVTFAPDRTVVHYVQVLDDPAGGAPEVLPNAGTEFVFDLIGGLVEIENHTLLP